MNLNLNFCSIFARIETAKDKDSRDSEGSKDSTDTSASLERKIGLRLHCLVWIIGLVEGTVSMWRHCEYTRLACEDLMKKCIFLYRWLPRGSWSRLRVSPRRPWHSCTACGYVAFDGRFGALTAEPHDARCGTGRGVERLGGRYRLLWDPAVARIGGKANGHHWQSHWLVFDLSLTCLWLVTSLVKPSERERESLVTLNQCSATDLYL